MAHQYKALIDVRFIDEVDRAFVVIVNFREIEIRLAARLNTAERLCERAFDLISVKIAHHADHHIFTHKVIVVEVDEIFSCDAINRFILAQSPIHGVFAINQPLKLTVADLLLVIIAARDTAFYLLLLQLNFFLGKSRISDQVYENWQQLLEVLLQHVHAG